MCEIGLTVPGVLLAARRRARWAVPGPVDEPGFFFGEADIIRAAITPVIIVNNKTGKFFEKNTNTHHS